MTTAKKDILTNEENQQQKKPSHKKTESIMCLPDERRQIIENMLDLEDWEVDEDPMYNSDEESVVLETPLPPPAPLDMDSSDEESVPETPQPAQIDWEQRFYIQRNSTSAMTNTLMASMRYMRVDIERIQRDGPWSESIAARTAAMRYRLEHMERVVEAFEERDYFTLYRLTPRRLFDVNDTDNSE